MSHASIERVAARGVAWNLATGVGTRVLGLIGTLILTRFITPAQYGEVAAAAICVLTADRLLFFAIGQYIIANRSRADVAFQAAVFHFVLGLIAMTFVFAFRGPLGVMLDAPEMGRFILGYAVALVIDRARAVPTTLLIRDLRFRAVAIINSVGEVTFTGTALALAWRYGGYAMVAGAVARAAITCVLFLASAPRVEWLKPARLQATVARRLLAYGAPIMLSNLADRAASTWDNLIMLRLFGANVMGAYALAYSLAETPLIYVAERMSDVLMPAFSKMELSERPAAVIRAAGLMTLVVGPLGVGLGSVAPTIVRVFFDTRWAGMTSILTMLSVMTVFQPLSWSAIAYLQAEMMTRAIMVMSFVKAALVLALVALLGWRAGPTWACAGVGAGYAVHSVLTVFLTARLTPLSARAYFTNVLRPLAACLPMFLAVTRIRMALTQWHVPGPLSLIAEIICGAIVYVGSVFVIADGNVRELIRFVRPAPDTPGSILPT